MKKGETIAFMLKPGEIWIKNDSHFNQIVDNNNILNITWNENVDEDYINMADSFYAFAHVITSMIVEDLYDNEKTDQWFFPAMFLYRQAIELICKGLILINFSRKESAFLFNQHRHDISSLFSLFCSASEHTNVGNKEIIWLNGYLEELERIDGSSNLFRYPIKDGALKEYNHRFLDVVDMANGLEQCYALLFACLPLKYDPQKYCENIDLTMDTKVVYFASGGIGNCMLYNSIWDEGYYSHIQGYSKCALILKETMPSNQWSLLTISYLLRHAIELVLKKILHSRTEVHVEISTITCVCRSHSIYKKLWKKVKFMVEHYAQKMGEDLSQIELGDAYLKELGKLDPSGYKFRYPTNLDLIHDFDFDKIDYNHATTWLMEIFNFLDGCSGIMDEAYDYECEMRSYNM